MSQNGIYLKIIDYDDLFRHQGHAAIIMNDFDMDLTADRSRLNSLIYASLDGDAVSNTARCDCGEQEGMDKYGMRCSSCLSLVVPVTEKPLESILWLKVPKGITKFINLTIWRILQKNLTHSGYSILDYITNPRYAPSQTLAEDKRRKLERLDLPIGYNSFVENYEAIMVALFKAGLIGPSASAPRRRKIMRFLQENVKNTFSEYLPFPTRLGFIKESSNNRIQVDPKMVAAIDAAQILIGIDNREASESQPSLSLANKEARMVTALNRFNEYYKTFETEVIFQKPGIARKLVYGTRPYFGFRSVITSRQKPHKQNALEMPWSLSVLLFEQHIKNKLLKMEYTPNEMKAMVVENTLRYHPIIDRIFDELLAESEGGTIPTLFGRNPTLTRTSVGFNQIDVIKDDPTDNTISISPLNLIDKNADFDGKSIAVVKLP